jgi:glycine oxidase
LEKRASAYKKIDCLIIGQGVAGSCMAIQLLRRNKSVMVIDNPSANISTAVAAGLVNPVTGKMLTKTWMAETLFPYLQTFYRGLEELLNSRFYHSQSIYRPFVSVEEQNEWMGRSTYKSIRPFIETISPVSLSNGEVHDPVGGVLFRCSGYLDAAKFTESVKHYLIQKECYREENFDEALLELGAAHVSYQNIQSDKIIFCRGVEELQGGYFSWLPIKPLKGEIIQVRMRPLKYLYNRRVYIVPGREQGTHYVGATYDFGLTREPTAKGLAELTAHLKELVKIPFEVVHQFWGIRPTTHDRRPILGAHPNHKNVIIFNGLGTKGVSLAPYFSNQLADWLDGAGELHSEVNIRRFKSLYS